SSQLSFAQEIEKVLGDKTPPIIRKIGAGFSGISATANAYQFKQDPNVDNALNLSSDVVNIGSFLKPTSKFFGRANIYLSGAMAVSELSEKDYIGAGTDSLPLTAGAACAAGGVSAPLIPACMAAGALASAVTDTVRSAYQNS